MDYLLCGNLPYPAWKKHISVQNLSNRRIRRYLVCRLKRPEARDFSHVRFTELDGFEKKFEIRITEFSKIMFISFRFGSSDWCSISYSPYLDTWQSKQFIFPNCKYGINLFIALFDTSTGKILRARMLDLPCLFSKKIRSAIVLQALQPFNKEKYIKVIKQFTFFHSQEEIAVQSKLSSRCTVHYRASQTVPIQK